MVSRRPARTLQGSGHMDTEGSQADRRERLNDQEVNQGGREEGKQAQVHGAQGSTARMLPEVEKLHTPHVQIPSPHAVQNPVTSHRLSRPQNPVQTIQQPEHHEAPTKQH
jgi:hypothetical protein